MFDVKLGLDHCSKCFFKFAVSKLTSSRMAHLRVDQSMSWFVGKSTGKHLVHRPLLSELLTPVTNYCMCSELDKSHKTERQQCLRNNSDTFTHDVLSQNNHTHFSLPNNNINNVNVIATEGIRIAHH